MNTKERISYLVSTLDLNKHPEGGFYKEVYRSEQSIDRTCLPSEFSGNRHYATSIYFMLTSESFSAFHRINQDETWHFYEGSPIELHTISPAGNHTKYIIGADLSNGQVYQLTVPAKYWFASKVIEEDSYSLVGCSVAPGFDFDDFELANRSTMIKSFPNHEALILGFTR